MEKRCKVFRVSSKLQFLASAILWLVVIEPLTDGIDIPRLRENEDMGIPPSRTCQQGPPHSRLLEVQLDPIQHVCRRNGRQNKAHDPADNTGPAVADEFGDPFRSPHEGIRCGHDNQHQEGTD